MINLAYLPKIRKSDSEKAKNSLVLLSVPLSSALEDRLMFIACSLHIKKQGRVNTISQYATNKNIIKNT